MTSAWKLVPLEPDWAMQIAGRNAIIDAASDDNLDVSTSDAAVCYRAMIVAAPTQFDDGWLPIETARRDGRPIVGWCNHAADIWQREDGKLTTYAAHAEGLGHAGDGPRVLVWGGEYEEEDHLGNSIWIPNWWFVLGSDFMTPANPTIWRPIPDPQKGGGG